MRIAHILPYNLRQPGGVQTHTLALDSALRDLGHASEVFAPTHPLRLPLGGTRADLTLHPLDLLALRRLLRTPHDILHIQEPILPLAGPLALLHPRRPPTVLTLHSAEPAAARAYRWTRPLARAFLRRADAVVCASGIARRNAAGILPDDADHARVIFPALDLAPFRAVRRDPQPNAVLFVGRDEPRKGLGVLLEAMRGLPDDQLVVAGPVSQQTKDSAPANAAFLGPVPHEDIPTLMASASSAVFPALGGEALGLVLIEAMAAGVPVAASDIDGYRVASQDGRAALLSPPGDADALAANIRRLRSDADLRAQLTTAGRASAERFDARAVAEQHLDLYRFLLPA